MTYTGVRCFAISALWRARRHVVSGSRVVPRFGSQLRCLGRACIGIAGVACTAQLLGEVCGQP
eukprot:880937-Prorocentrum_minimum.AAC.5